LRPRLPPKAMVVSRGTFDAVSGVTKIPPTKGAVKVRRFPSTGSVRKMPLGL
jgi:hypothetical protein